MIPVSLTAAAMASMLLTGSLIAQESEPSRARWWIGGLVGLTELGFNGALHSLGPLHEDIASPDGFVHGGGSNLLLGAIIEYDAGGPLGGTLALCYDDRSVSLWNGRPPDSPDRPRSRKVVTYLRYLSIEASLRIDVWKGLTVLAGPSLGLNIRNRLIYRYTPPARQISDPRYPDLQDYGRLEQARSTIIEGEATVRWDCPLDAPGLSTAGMIAAPFVTYRITGNLLDPPDGISNSYAATTFRAGVELKFALGDRGARRGEATGGRP